jgi:hypothetical protein
VNATLRVQVVGTWSIEPDVVDFGAINIHDAERSTTSSMLEFTSSSDRLAGAPVVRAAWLDCEYGERNGDQEPILLRLHPDRLAPGLNTTTVVIATTSKAKPNGSIFVRAVAVQELYASPQRLILAGADEGRVLFRDQFRNSVRLVSAAASDERVQTRIGDAGELIAWVNHWRGPDSEVIVNAVDEQGRRGAVAVSYFRKEQ